MAKRKFYGIKQAKLFERYGSTREATWRRYKKLYMKVSEDYGNNMTPMMPKSEFLASYKKEIELSESHRALSVTSFVYHQIDATHKEAKAASTNFNRHMAEICEKANKGKSLTKIETDLLNQNSILKQDPKGNYYFEPKKVTYKDVRGNSQKWQDIYENLEDNNVQDQMLGSK